MSENKNLRDEVVCFESTEPDSILRRRLKAKPDKVYTPIEFERDFFSDLDKLLEQWKKPNYEIVITGRWLGDNMATGGNE